MGPRREFLRNVVGAVVAAAFFASAGVPSPDEKKPEPGAASAQPLFPRRPSVKGLKLKASPNGRYFVDQDGKPFFYLGDTCWLLFQRLNRKEVDEYLKDRAG